MSTTHREFKDSLYEQFARVGKALAAPKRLELLDLLSQGPRTVEALANESACSIANTSQHLQVLRGARLVETTRQGTFVEYRLASAAVSATFLSLRALAEAQLAEVAHVTRDYFEQRGALEPVDEAVLLQRIAQGEVTVLDVRPAAEYRAGHLPGALSMPVAELAARLRELPPERDVVAYCRGPYCVMAIDAVNLLRERGFRAQRLELGVADFRVRGLKVDTQPSGAAP